MSGVVALLPNKRGGGLRLVTLAALTFVVYKLYFYLFYRKRSVAGDVVLITGGGSGIGRLMALRFAKLGAKIILWDVDTAGMHKVRDEIVSQGGTCASYTVDVTDRTAVYEMARMAESVDILINNAGIVTGKPLLECDDRLVEKTLLVNTMSHFWTIKAFLPGMLQRDKGHIVTIASAAGMNGVPGLVDYCASKFGAVGTGEALYAELRKRGSKVRSTVVCPSFINTGMFDGVKPPMLVPLLEPDYTADRIVLAIRRGEEMLCMPAMVGLTRGLKVLPTTWQYHLGRILGMTKSMDEFTGRSKK